MKFDPVDVFGEAVWHVLSRSFSFVACIWVSCVIVLVSIGQWGFLSNLDDSYLMILIAPYMLVNILLPFTISILIGGGYWFNSERSLSEIVPTFTSLLSLMVMLRETKGDAMDRVLQWSLWLACIATIYGVFWHFRSSEKVKLAKEFDELYRENEQNRIELKEKFGTDSFDSLQEDRSTSENLSPKKFPKNF